MNDTIQRRVDRCIAKMLKLLIWSENTYKHKGKKKKRKKKEEVEGRNGRGIEGEWERSREHIRSFYYYCIDLNQH
jgi:hypothetical protein